MQYEFGTQGVNGPQGVNGKQGVNGTIGMTNKELLEIQRILLKINRTKKLKEIEESSKIIEPKKPKKFNLLKIIYSKK